MRELNNEANRQGLENARRATVLKTLETLESLAHETVHEIEDEINALQTIDMTRAPDIFITFNLGAATDLEDWPYTHQPVKEPTALTIVLRDTYRAEACFHNPVTGEPEQFDLTPQEQQRLNHYAALTGRFNVRVYEILRTNADTIGNLSSIDTTTLELLISGHLIHTQELAAELRQREGDIQPMQKDALRRCLETSHELFIQSLEAPPPPTEE